MLGAHQRYPDQSSTYHDFCRTYQQSTRRLKEKPYKDYTLVHNMVSEVCPHPYPHTSKYKKPFSQDLQHNTRGAEELQGDQALGSPLLSGLVLSKGEHAGSLHGIRQPLHVQMVLEHRRLCMMQAPYSHGAARYSQPADGHQHGTLTELQPRSAESNRRVLVGMEVGVDFPVQDPYMSLNFQQVLGKHSSMKALPFTTLNHISDSHSDHGKDISSYSCISQFPSSSLSPDSQRETPHYVIITNER